MRVALLAIAFIVCGNRDSEVEPQCRKTQTSCNPQDSWLYLQADHRYSSQLHSLLQVDHWRKTNAVSQSTTRVAMHTRVVPGRVNRSRLTTEHSISNLQGNQKSRKEVLASSSTSLQLRINKEHDNVNSSSLATEHVSIRISMSFHQRIYLLLGMLTILVVCVAGSSQYLFRSSELSRDTAGLVPPRRSSMGFAEIAAFALVPEMGWAVFSCLMVPLLLRLGTPAWLTGLGWAISSVLSIAIQPAVGAASDSQGRGSLAACCAATSALGMLTLAIIESFVGGYNGPETWVTLIVVFTAADVSHDACFTIARANFSDYFQDNPALGTAQADIFLKTGSALGFLLVLVPWRPEHSYMEVSGSFAAAGCLMAMVALFLTVCCWRTSGFHTDDHQQESYIADNMGEKWCNISILRELPRSAIHIMLLSLAGWWAMTSFDFYTTSFTTKEKDSTFLGLVQIEVESDVDQFDMVVFMFFLQALLTIVLSLQISNLYSITGKKPLRVLQFGAALFVMRLVMMLTRKSWCVCIGTALHCVNNLIITNFPFLWLEIEFRNTGENEQTLVREHRGFLTGVLNNMIPLGTLGSGLLGGKLMESIGGFGGSLFFPAILNLIVLLYVVIDQQLAPSSEISPH